MMITIVLIVIVVILVMLIVIIATKAFDSHGAAQSRPPRLGEI